MNFIYLLGGGPAVFGMHVKISYEFHFCLPVGKSPIYLWVNYTLGTALCQPKLSIENGDKNKKREIAT
jgi:hypothetical protein